MRVISGTAGGIRLDVPPNPKVRPTIDRVREATFNALFSMGLVDGVRVLDLFAGSGALGIEALSRGAAHAVFVEQDRATAAIISANLERCRLQDSATVVTGDAYAWLARLNRSSGSSDHFDVALLDPPYRFEDWAELLPQVPADTLVLESNRTFEIGDDFEVLRQRKYGSTVVTIAVGAGGKDQQPAASLEGEG